MFIGIPFLILQLAILYFAVVGIRYTLSRQRDNHGIIFVRDILKYAALMLAVLITCFGLSGILSNLLEHSDGTYSSKIQLARWLSFVVIGIPVVAVIGLWIRRDFKKTPETSTQPAWQLYLLVATSASLLLWFIPIQSYLTIIAGDIYRPRALAQSIVAFAVWLVHVYLIQRHSSLLANAQRFVGWFVGAVTVVVGAISFISYWIERSVDFDLGTYQLAESVISIIVGAPIFYFYWREFAGTTTAQEARIYRLFGGLALPALFLTIAATFVVTTTMTWYFGTTPQTARQFFDEVPQQGSAVVVLLIVAAIFHSLIRGFYRDEITRIYQYLLGGAALVAAASGVGTMIAGSMAEFEKANTIIFGASLTFMTAPQWAYLWSRCQQALHIDIESEFRSPIRRTYIYFFIGVPTLAGIASAVWLTFNAFKALLLGDQHIWQSRIPIAGLSVTVVIALYHFLVLRKERGLV